MFMLLSYCIPLIDVSYWFLCYCYLTAITILFHLLLIFILVSIWFNCHVFMVFQSHFRSLLVWSLLSEGFSYHSYLLISYAIVTVTAIIPSVIGNSYVLCYCHSYAFVTPMMLSMPLSLISYWFPSNWYLLFSLVSLLSLMPFGHWYCHSVLFTGIHDIHCYSMPYTRCHSFDAFFCFPVDLNTQPMIRLAL